MASAFELITLLIGVVSVITFFSIYPKIIVQSSMKSVETSIMTPTGYLTPVTSNVLLVYYTKTTGNYEADIPLKFYPPKTSTGNDLMFITISDPGECNWQISKVEYGTITINGTYSPTQFTTELKNIPTFSQHFVNVTVVLTSSYCDINDTVLLLYTVTPNPDKNYEYVKIYLNTT